MNIYVVHSSAFDFQNELYIPIRSSELNNLHQFVLPHEDGQTVNSNKFIEDADLILAEVSYPSTGEGIEIGWANAKGKKIVCIYKTGSKYSSSLKFISETFIEYSNNDDLINKLSNFLKQVL